MESYLLRDCCAGAEMASTPQPIPFANTGRPCGLEMDESHSEGACPSCSLLPNMYHSFILKILLGLLSYGPTHDLRDPVNNRAMPHEPTYYSCKIAPKP